MNYWSYYHLNHIVEHISDRITSLLIISNGIIELQLHEYEKFKSREYKTDGWLNTGEFRISDHDSKAMVVANAIVASTIINSDAAITKR